MRQAITALIASLLLMTGCSVPEGTPSSQLNDNENDVPFESGASVLSNSADVTGGSELLLEEESIAESSNDVGINVFQASEYIFPSDTRYISNSDLQKMSAQKIMLARNEIYARHGYDFQQKAIRNYFLSKSWYHPVTGLNGSSFDESVFNQYERINRDTILQYELDNKPLSLEQTLSESVSKESETPEVVAPLQAETTQTDTEQVVEDTTEIQEENISVFPLSGHIICIDPGHGITPLVSKGLKGPVSPLSNATKPLYTFGTEGANLTEEKLNLLVGLKLRDRLKSLGAEVLMTREVSEISITGVERCEIANRGGADVNIHIHADGVDDSRAHGVSVLVPTGDLLGTPSILDESVRLGKLMVDCVAKTTGAKNRGISPRSDMTGFNFSEVPSVLIEMGFMTNREEDALLETDEYQDKIVDGMVQSLFLWYGIEN